MFPWFLSSPLLLLCAEAAGVNAATHSARALKIAKRFMSFLLPIEVCILHHACLEAMLFGERKEPARWTISYDAPLLPEVGWPKQLFSDSKEGNTVFHATTVYTALFPALHSWRPYAITPSVEESTHAERNPGSDETRWSTG